MEYRLPPPLMGEHTEEIIMDLLGYSSEQIIESHEQGRIKMNRLT